MRKLIICVSIMLFVLVVSVGFPAIIDLIFGNLRAEWASEILSEAMREKSELVVYEVEVRAQETFTQEAWLVGTVQCVKIPYTFALRYTVDLSRAEIILQGRKLVIKLPAPEARYQQLNVDEQSVDKQDWLYPLTTEQYAEMKEQLVRKLLKSYSVDSVHLDKAWQTAAMQVESLFEALTQKNLLISGFELLVEKME